MEYTPRMLDAALTARSAAAAGMVLLKNVQNALPLTAEDGEALPVAVFGSGQIFTPCCEAAMDPWRKVSVLDGLCASRTACSATSTARGRWSTRRAANIRSAL